MANMRVVVVEVSLARTLTFPAPTGETFTFLKVMDVAGTPLYTWNGTAWVLFL